MLPWDVEQFELADTLKIWTWKVSFVAGMSSKVQTSPTFKLLSSANVFHPLDSSNLLLVSAVLIRYLACQTLPFNTSRLISPLFLRKSMCFLQNLDGKFCQGKENLLLPRTLRLSILVQKNRYIYIYIYILPQFRKLWNTVTYLFFNCLLLDLNLKLTKERMFTLTPYVSSMFGTESKNNCPTVCLQHWLISWN